MELAGEGVADVVGGVAIRAFALAVRAVLITLLQPASLVRHGHYAVQRVRAVEQPVRAAAVVQLRHRHAAEAVMPQVLRPDFIEVIAVHMLPLGDIRAVAFLKVAPAAVVVAHQPGRMCVHVDVPRHAPVACVVGEPAHAAFISHIAHLAQPPEGVPVRRVVIVYDITYNIQPTILSS